MLSGRFLGLIAQQQAFQDTSEAVRLAMENRMSDNSFDNCLRLRSVGHVQCQGRDAPFQVGQGLARTGIHPFRGSPQGFFEQRLSDTATGPGHQNCSICDCHFTLQRKTGRSRTAEARRPEVTRGLGWQQPT
jgi:hypothetical protein